MKNILSLTLLVALSPSALARDSDPEGVMYNHPDDTAAAPGELEASRLAFAAPTPVSDPRVLVTYARQLSSVLAGRPLTKQERSRLTAEGEAALSDMVRVWLDSPFFATSFRTRVEMLIGSNGSRDGVDFDLPGNLAAYVINNKLPLETILTADYCVDAKGSKIKCDTGAPFAAGVLGTRGFLLGHAGRFNLGRANSMMGAFACTRYPMSTILQPPIPKEQLIENFRILTEEDAEQAGTTGFGNGAACYTCHSQFGAHTQFFVKFDDKGLYKAEATGLQSDKLEFGRSDNGLYRSHYADEARAASEKGNMFGQDAENLAAGAKILANSPTFLQCMAKQAITHGLNLDSEATRKISQEALVEIIKGVSAEQPKVTDLYHAVLVHPLVIRAFAQGVGE